MSNQPNQPSAPHPVTQPAPIQPVKGPVTDPHPPLPAGAPKPTTK